MKKLIDLIVNGLKLCIQSPTALVGLVASIIVLISMCFNTSTKRGELLMRILNGIGSIVCVIYAIMLGLDGVGTFILNAILIFVNFYYIIKLLKKSNNK